MLAKLAIVALAASSAFAAIVPRDDGCNTGTVQCCDQIQTPVDAEYEKNFAAVAGLLSGIGIPIKGNSIPIGVGCTPITIIGAASGSNCQGQTVCCQHNTGGPVAVDCIPINLNL